MNLKEAKSLIALYLTGQHVEADRLREACKVVPSEPDYIRHLRQELGLDDDWTSECEIFLANASEMSEMSRQEREREMPEIVAHLGVCDSCRRAYWIISPTWIAERAGTLKEKGGELRKALAEQIRLTIDELGRLVGQGLGPPAAIPSYVAGMMSGGGSEFFPEEASEQERRKLWLLSDEESDCVVQLEIEGRGATEASVGCSIRCKGDEPVDASSVRIEVRDAQSGSLQLAGRLSDFEQEPLILGAGSWLIRLQITEKTATRSWEIPLELAPGR